MMDLETQVSVSNITPLGHCGPSRETHREPSEAVSSGQIGSVLRRQPAPSKIAVMSRHLGKEVEIHSPPAKVKDVSQRGNCNEMHSS